MMLRRPRGGGQRRPADHRRGLPGHRPKPHLRVRMRAYRGARSTGRVRKRVLGIGGPAMAIHHPGPSDAVDSGVIDPSEPLIRKAPRDA